MMTSDLKPYPAYKDADVEWLVEMPTHWQVRKLRNTIRSAAELPEVDPLAEDDLDGTIHDEENSNLDELEAAEEVPA